MPYIPLEEHLPGITGLLEYRKDSASPIRELTQILLRGPSSLTEGERELIATIVSHRNQCTFCVTAHMAAADILLGEEETARSVRADISTAPVSDKMKALLTIAAQTQESGKAVTDAAIAHAKAAGATDIEIHDTVLIAALFGTGSGDQLNPLFIPQNQTGEIRVAHPSFATDIETGDDRIGKALLRTATASLNGLSSNRDVWVYTSSTGTVLIIRNEELILIYAEANIQKSNFPEAVTAINKIRTTHNLPVYSGALTQAALVTEMLKQRRDSLFYEGHRWIDMRRYNLLATLPIDRTGDDVWDKFPLPVTEQ